MSTELRLDAKVTVDAAQAQAGLAATATSSTAVAGAMRATGAAATTASAGLTQQATAARAAATATAAVANEAKSAAAAIAGEAAASRDATAATSALTTSQRAAADAQRALASAHRASGDAAGFNRSQQLELLHVGKSLFDEIAAGASPFRALTVEGGRIGEIIAGSGGVTKAFGSLVGVLGGPLVVAGAAAAAAVVGLIVAFDSGVSSAAKFEANLVATGNAAALTRDRFEALKDAIAAAAQNGGAEAETLATTFAASGARSREQIYQLGVVTARFAEDTGQSTEKVAAYFAKAQAGPTEFATKFVQSYAGISAAQLRQIRELEDSGHAAAAAELLAKDLFDYYGTKAPVQLGIFGTALRRHVIDDLKDAGEAIEHFFAKATLGEQRAAAAAAVQYDRKVGYDDSADVRRLAALDKQIADQKATADATAHTTAVQRDGATAAAELESKYAKIGDSARRADADVAKFRATLKAALAADPNNPTALDLQKRAPQIEKDIREKDQPEATAADKKAATAAAEAEKARVKKQKDLADTITLIEGEATAATQVKQIREEETKILELQKQYGVLFTAQDEARVRNAIQLKTLNEGITAALKAAAELKLPTPSDIFAKQDKAQVEFERKRQTGVESPETLDDVAANAAKRLDEVFDEEHGHKFGESIAQQFQSTASRIGQLIGEAAGGRIGSELSRVIASATRGIGTAPGGLGILGQGVQEGFAQFNKDTSKTLGNLFTSVFGNKGSDFGKTVGTAFAGASTGQLAGSIVGALGVKTSNAGSEIGGAIGGLAFGPLGSIIGGVAGGILGGLFGKKATSNSDVLTSAITSGTVSGSNTIQQTAAKGLGSQVQNGLEQIAQALGGTLQSFAPITIGQRNDNYRVDTTGATIGKYNGKDFGTGDAAAAAAVSYAVETALQRGAIGGLSAHVQAVIAQYGDDLNKAVSEAIKVKNLEDIIGNAANPYATVFRDFEQQARQRVEVAKQYGFDVLQVEKINADQRAKLLQDTLSQATASVQSAINDLKFGSRATGSVVEQRAALTAEEQRLKGLVAGGDTSQLGALTQIVQQLVDLDKQAYGSTAAYSASRDDAVTLLQSLVDQTNTKITTAADFAAGTPTAAEKADPSAAALEELNASADDQVTQQQTTNTLLSGLPAAIAAALATSGGGSLAALYTRQAVK